MSGFQAAISRLGESIAALGALSVDGLQFWQRDTARLVLMAILGLSLAVLLFRAFRLNVRNARPVGLVLPALTSARAGRHAWVRHLAIVPFVAGVPFFLVALADPFTPLVSEEVEFQGRRISLMIDASTSMTTTFETETLNTVSKTGPAFFTTVAAAERFVQLRQKARYRDLFALIEFGDQAYVITPFTSDCDNVLLSIALIRDPVEFSKFPNRGTVISRALEQSLALFKAFDVLEASGNLMVIFTDGEDTTALLEGRKLDQILASAAQNKVPLYFVRTNYQKGLGELIPDRAWKAAVERTGGRFYAVSDEASLLRAIHDVDRLANGRIHVRQYSSQQPQYDRFAFAAALFWTLAATLKLTLPLFQQIP
jgi:hypothetical protein